MGKSSSAAGPLLRRPAHAALAGLVASGALAALAGCGGTPYGRVDARVEMERLSAALEGQQAEIRRLVSKISVLERRLGAPTARRDVRGGRAVRPASPGSAPTGGAIGAGRSSSSPPAAPPSTPSTTSRTTTSGAGDAAAPSVGPTSDVRFTRKVQEALKLAGLDPGQVDGKMGPRTSAALRQFQRENNLPATGTANPDTWARLKRYLPDDGSP